MTPTEIDAIANDIRKRTNAASVMITIRLPDGQSVTHIAATAPPAVKQKAGIDQ